MKHPHYDKIVQWAQDTSQKVWSKDCEGSWVRIVNPVWFTKYQYHIGPTPPETMRTLGGLEYPAPETEAPNYGASYYVTRISGKGASCVDYIWRSDTYDYNWLEAGLVHSTKEAAEAHTRAILAAIKQANQGE